MAKIVDDQHRMDVLTAPGGAFPLIEFSLGANTMTTFDREPRTLRDAFLTARSFGTATALVYEDERWTFEEMWEIEATLASALRTEFGIAKGDRVGIVMRNYPEFIFIFAALQLMGAIAIPYNAWLQGDELVDLIAESQPLVVFADRERVNLLATHDIKSLGVRALVGVRYADAGSGVIQYRDLIEGTPRTTEPPVVDVFPDEASSILFTSGTTGRPKAAEHSHRNHSASLLNKLIRAVQVNVDDEGTVVVTPPLPSVKLVTYPLFHIAGLNTMYNTLYSGQSLVLMYKWDPEEALRLVEAEHVNEISGPPYVIQTFISAAAVSTRDLSSLRSIGMGGASSPVDVIEQIERVFGTSVTPRSGYGMTETTSGVVGISGADFVRHPTSVGRVLPTAEIAIMDEDGNQLPIESEGEVCIRGPQVILGGTASTASDEFVDGWFHTGDIGRIDPEGFVFIVGRIKDIVIRGGENINCAEVEFCLSSHSDVLEAVVFGVPHPTLGEELYAIVHVDPGAEVTSADLQAYVGARLARFKVPAKIAVVSTELPRTATGKLQKKGLAATFAAEFKTDE